MPQPTYFVTKKRNNFRHSSSLLADKLILCMPKRWVFHLLKGLQITFLYLPFSSEAVQSLFFHSYKVSKSKLKLILFLPKNHRAILWWIFETSEVILRKVSLYTREPDIKLCSKLKKTKNAQRETNWLSGSNLRS